jgi:hypothetical protein
MLSESCQSYRCLCCASQQPYHADKSPKLAPAATNRIVKLLGKIWGYLPAIIKGNKNLTVLSKCVEGACDSMQQMAEAPKQAMAEAKKK